MREKNIMVGGFGEIGGSNYRRTFFQRPPFSAESAAEAKPGESYFTFGPTKGRKIGGFGGIGDLFGYEKNLG